MSFVYFWPSHFAPKPFLGLDKSSHGLEVIHNKVWMQPPTSAGQDCLILLM